MSLILSNLALSHIPVLQRYRVLTESRTPIKSMLGSVKVVPLSINYHVSVEALRASQHFFSHIGRTSWVEPVLSKGKCVQLKDTA